MTTSFVEQDGITTASIRILYASRDARDAVLQSPMEEDLNERYDTLADRFLRSFCARVALFEESTQLDQARPDPADEFCVDSARCRNL
ncbi:MAG: hypothetical protein MJE77_45335 [Proteobacteria bacterium]|nr:hypothetical protein [Pseudomonadota bacterium]